MKGRSKAAIAIVAAMMLAFTLIPARAAVPRTKRVSVKSNGDQAEGGGSFYPSISSNGRFVAFESVANLVNGDNDDSDIYLYDRETKKIRRVSVSSQGEAGNSDSYTAAVSPNGRYVAFESYADNLVGNDDNEESDVFVHDRKTRRTRRVSVTSNGEEDITGGSFRASLSASGRFVAFESDAGNLVPNDDNLTRDVFIHDRETGRTRRVSLTNSGEESALGGTDASISATGRYVAFASASEDLVGSDSNGEADVFVRDRKLDKTRRVNLRSDGEEAEEGGPSYNPSISADGRFVAFWSYAANLVGNDANLVPDVFVYDRETKQIRRVSVRSDGDEAEGGDSLLPSISPDGRFVSYESLTTNLVGSDGNGVTDVFVFDRRLRKTKRVSVANNGDEADSGSQETSISNGGRFVAFHSGAEDLVSDDDNGQVDIFVRGPLR